MTKREVRGEVSLDSIDVATRRYERWLAKRVPLIAADLALKHAQMAVSPFQFLRATHYRWAQVFLAKLPELSNARRVLSVADLHVENFGTWRDAEGRLSWGVNDFDEAADLPFPYDLVRLATSAAIASALHGVSTRRSIEATLLQGYRASLQAGGSPCVLAEGWPGLRAVLAGVETDAAELWKKLRGKTLAASQVPGRAREALLNALPGNQDLQIYRRIAGLGSLGRQRFAGLVSWHGAEVAREVKRLAPSAAVWAGWATEERVQVRRILARAVRDPDPEFRVEGSWAIRRLSPDCVKLELATLGAKPLLAADLLFAMGWEAANVHIGSASPQSILRDLAKLPKHWLRSAAITMRQATESDWRAWRTATRGAKRR